MDNSKLEAIIICVGQECADFLAITLPHNKKFFDNIIVITDNNSDRIQEVCARNNANCIKTNDFYLNGAKFRKGVGYNLGFKNLKYNDYVCLIDADTFIPDEFAELKKTYNWSIEPFYGARRIIIPTLSEFIGIVGNEIKIDNYWCPFGIGYGFFGIFNLKSQAIKRYGLYYEENDGVGESDWKFHARWGQNSKDHKSYSGLLTELPIKVYHLSMPGGCGFERVDFWK